jgi:hypothetical protein
MRETLYSQLTDVEEMNEKLKELKNPNLIDVPSLQKELFECYEKNPVLYDAMQDKQSVNESLEELTQINKGIKKILPWRKDKVHNERLKQMGKLIYSPSHLYTTGIFTPDNLITTGVYTTAMAFGMFWLFEPSLTFNPTSKVVQELFQFKVPLATSALMAPLFGLMTNFPRFNNLFSISKEQAKYLDGKVEEFFR